jgi:hypothetical protein
MYPIIFPLPSNSAALQNLAPLLRFRNWNQKLTAAAAAAAAAVVVVTNITTQVHWKWREGMDVPNNFPSAI